MSGLLIAIFEVLYYAIDIYKFILIAMIIVSWLIAFNVINTYNRFVAMLVDALHRLTEPALRPIRRFMPNRGGIDISPIILFLILFFIQSVIVRSIIPAIAGF